MKTAITVVNTVQISMDEYKDVRKTKIFEDHDTILSIKKWIKRQHKAKFKLTAYA